MKSFSQFPGLQLINTAFDRFVTRNFYEILKKFGILIN